MKQEEKPSFLLPQMNVKPIIPGVKSNLGQGIVLSTQQPWIIMEQHPVLCVSLSFLLLVHGYPDVSQPSSIMATLSKMLNIKLGKCARFVPT
jgi:hypothetical protein